MATARRRPLLKWQPLAPPTPRVLNFPRRLPKLAGASGKRRTKRLEALFHEERAFGKVGMRLDYDVPIVVLNAAGGRERVVAEEEEEDGRRHVAGVESEMLRAECRFLRMERELALKKLKRNRARMERLLRSALQTLISGRDKVGGEGGIVCDSLEEEIEAMRCKLVDLQRVSGAKVFESHHRNSSSNFDDQNSNFRSRLVPDGNQIPREIQELAEASLSIHADCAAEQSIGESSRFTDMELLSRKMSGLSKGLLLERMEASNDLMKLSKLDTSVDSYASTSWTREMPDSASDTQHSLQDGMADEEKPCSGRCRAVVRRIVEQVQTETEQWSHMQEMLEKVKEEMGQLQASRDMWEQRALGSENQITSLNSRVQEWKMIAFSHETKVNDLQTQVQILQQELKMRRDGATNNSSSQTEDASEKEKRVLICQLKENHNFEIANKQQGVSSEETKKQLMHSKRLDVPKRSPFRDIGNSSPLMRQITKVVFPGHR